MKRRDMRILIVCSYRNYVSDGIAPFIKEQAEALRTLAIDDRCVEIEYYLLHGKGIKGYLKEIPMLRKKIREYKPDVIHAHYGLSCLLANLATRSAPVVSTYHGTDINDTKVRRLSKIAIRMSAWNIFVSRKNMELAGCEEGKKASLIPCGIDDTLFVPMDKECARALLAESGKWKEESRELRAESLKRYVLFTKQFTNPVKNYPLAKAAVDMLNDANDANDVELVEFKGYTREESVMLMNAVDAVIMTSFSEGSPQVIKEAMACGCPIVSIDVGDVGERINGVTGCYLVRSQEPRELAEALEKALAFEGKTNGREKLSTDGLTNKQVAERLVEIYIRILTK